MKKSVWLETIAGGGTVLVQYVLNSLAAAQNHHGPIKNFELEETQLKSIILRVQSLYRVDITIFRRPSAESELCSVI